MPAGPITKFGLSRRISFENQPFRNSRVYIIGEIMKLFCRSIVLILGFGLVSCTPQIDFNYDPTVPFKTISTWAWYGDSSWADDYPKYQRNSPRPGRGNSSENPLMDRRVQLILERELLTIGMKKVEPENAEVLIYHYATFNKRPYTINKRYSMGDYFYTGFGWWGRGNGLGLSISQTERRYREEGTITIEIADNKTNRLIWQATAVDVLTRTGDPEQSDDEITQALRAALAKIPRTR